MVQIKGIAFAGVLLLLLLVGIGAAGVAAAGAGGAPDHSLPFPPHTTQDVVGELVSQVFALVNQTVCKVHCG